MYLIIMDTSLKVYCKSSLNKMYDSSTEIINKIEKIGGFYCLRKSVKFNDTNFSDNHPLN